jgi:hypothetical protein
VDAVISVTRHQVPDDRANGFRDEAEAALDLLRGRPGFAGGVVGRSVDDAEMWVLVTTWDDIGSFRRALSAYEVKMQVVPLLASAIDEPTAFERLVRADADGLVRIDSDRADDADSSGPGRD